VEDVVAVQPHFLRNIPKSSFHRHLNESGLANLQALKKPIDMAKATLIPYFSEIEVNSGKCT
jgi:hypothetical protein